MFVGVCSVRIFRRLEDLERIYVIFIICNTIYSILIEHCKNFRWLLELIALVFLSI